jgi:hypothetical protein
MPQTPGRRVRCRERRTNHDSAGRGAHGSHAGAGKVGKVDASASVSLREGYVGDSKVEISKPTTSGLTLRLGQHPTVGTPVSLRPGLLAVQRYLVLVPIGFDPTRNLHISLASPVVRGGSSSTINSVSLGSPVAIMSTASASPGDTSTSRRAASNQRLAGSMPRRDVINWIGATQQLVWRFATT